MALKNYEAFKKAMRLRESGDKYFCKNKFGFLGAYQFGMPRLCDFGLTERTGKNSFQWKKPFDETMFLTCQELQDNTFDLHVRDLKAKIEKKYTEYMKRNIFIENTEITISGCVAVAHLLGLGGLGRLLLHGNNGKDALGTSAIDYLTLFQGYNLDD
jgi:hypothetical protein